MVCWATFVHNISKRRKKGREKGKNTFMKFKTNIKKHKIKVLIQSYPPPRQHHLSKGGGSLAGNSVLLSF